MNRELKYQNNLAQVREELTKISAEWKRPVPQLMVVTKGRKIADILELMSLGERELGENRVDELEEKSRVVQQSTPHENEQVHWHFIGHLQSNKIKKLLSIPGLVAIHSVDRLELLQKLFQAEHLLSSTKKIQLYLQVNTSGEKEKGGFKTWVELCSGVEWYLEKIQQGNHSLTLAGLMTLGNIRGEDFEADAKQCFQHLEKFKIQLECQYPALSPLGLSMGMSQDYAWAIPFGPQFVRIGGKIFGG